MVNKYIQRAMDKVDAAIDSLDLTSDIDTSTRALMPVLQSGALLETGIRSLIAQSTKNKQRYRSLSLEYDKLRELTDQLESQMSKLDTDIINKEVSETKIDLVNIKDTEDLIKILLYKIYPGLKYTITRPDTSSMVIRL